MSKAATSSHGRGVLGWHRVLDWRPRSALARVLIVFFLVAPIIVAGTMMWAMWDPSKYMRKIDLAVVNEDAGVNKQGAYTNYGDQVVEGLLDTDYLNFAEVNKEEGDQGLIKGKYLLVVTIPQDFSKQAVTIISDKPVKPEIHFASNDYYGTNGSVISSSLIPQVQTSVENAISKKYADQVIEGLKKLSDGLGTAADGAGRLDEGAGKLQEGGGRVVAGIGELGPAQESCMMELVRSLMAQPASMRESGDSMMVPLAWMMVQRNLPKAPISCSLALAVSPMVQARSMVGLISSRECSSQCSNRPKSWFLPFRNW